MVGGGVTITDGLCGVPDFESILLSCEGGQQGRPWLAQSGEAYLSFALGSKLSGHGRWV